MSTYKYPVSTIYATRLRLSEDSGVEESVRFGLFSIKAYAVSGYTHKIGINIMSLDAQPRDMLRSMIRQEMVSTETRLVAGMLVKVSAADPD